MQKVSIVITWFILITGCASTAKYQGNIEENSPGNAKETVEYARQNNITNNGFFISKGKISTSGESGRISLYFTMKYKLPGTYLISLRGKTGMEAFRIYISSDTVLINDRLNKTLLIGKNYDFDRITGIPADLLKVSVGDYFYNTPKYEENENCNDGEIQVRDYCMGLIIKTTIDCDIGKPQRVLITTGATDEYINLEYGKFRPDKNRVPKKIEIYDFRRKIKIKISINKYSYPWFGDIQFIPGSGYSIKPL